MILRVLALVVFSLSAALCGVSIVIAAPWWLPALCAFSHGFFLGVVVLWFEGSR